MTKTEVLDLPSEAALDDVLTEGDSGLKRTRTEFLGSGEWKSTNEILKTAREMEGLKEDTVRRAKGKLPIVVEKGKGKDAEWRWKLTLPEM